MQTGKLLAQRGEIVSPGHTGRVEQEGDEQTDLLWYLFHPYCSHQGRHGSTGHHVSSAGNKGQAPGRKSPKHPSGVLPAEPSSTQQGSLVFMLRLDLVYKAAAQLPAGLGLFPETATF